MTTLNEQAFEDALVRVGSMHRMGHRYNAWWFDYHYVTYQWLGLTLSARSRIPSASLWMVPGTWNGEDNPSDACNIS